MKFLIKAALVLSSIIAPLFLSAMTLEVGSFVGTITTIEGHVIVLDEKDKFIATPDTEFTVDAGKPAKLADMKVGMKVTAQVVAGTQNLKKIAGHAARAGGSNTHIKITPPPQN